MQWHVRGNDLLAVYEMPSGTSRIDVLWRVTGPGSGPVLARLDLLVSVRTERLDWRPDVHLESRLPEASAFGLTRIEQPELRPLVLNVKSPLAKPGSIVPGCLGFRVADRPWCYLEMVHPADLREDELNLEAALPPAVRLRRQLFLPESLEKGVILRARACGLFLPNDIDAADVAACYSEFAAADPFLGV